MPRCPEPILAETERKLSGNRLFDARSSQNTRDSVTRQMGTMPKGLAQCGTMMPDGTM